MSKPMTDDEYVGEGGNCCPYCRSNDTDGGDVEFDSEGASRQVACNDCNKRWVETFALTGWFPR